MLVPIPGFIKSIYATRFQVLNCIDMVQDPIFNHILFTQKTPGNTVGRKFQFKGLFCFCPLSLWMGCKMSIHKISPLFVCLWTSSSHNFPLCSLEHHPFSPLVCPLLNALSLLMRAHLYNDQFYNTRDYYYQKKNLHTIDAYSFHPTDYSLISLARRMLPTTRLILKTNVMAQNKSSPN